MGFVDKWVNLIMSSIKTMSCYSILTRNFMWRACCDNLPTKDNLHKRRVDVDVHLCSEESVGKKQRQWPTLYGHVIEGCTKSLESLWTHSNWRVQIKTASLTTWDGLDIRFFIFYFIITWNLWNNINKLVHEGLGIEPGHVFDSAHQTSKRLPTE